MTHHLIMVHGSFFVVRHPRREAPRGEYILIYQVSREETLGEWWEDSLFSEEAMDHRRREKLRGIQG